ASLFHSTLSERPYAGVTPAFAWVSCSRRAGGPAQTSGGSLNDSRVAATVWPSRETDTDGTKAPPVTWPLMLANTRDSPLFVSSDTMSDAPLAQAETMS